MQEPDPAVTEPLPLVTAISAVNNEAVGTNTQAFEYDGSTNGLPTAEIIESTKADNSRIDNIMTKLESYAKYGINNGLYNCYRWNTCPGYGGSGGYPVFPNFNANQAILRLINHQDYVRALNDDFQMHQREYGQSSDGLDISEIECQDGTRPENAGGGSYYCRGKANREGAIIILW